MKKVVFLSLFLTIALSGFAQMFNDANLLVYQRDLKQGNNVEDVYIVFENKTNYTMRVNFEAKYRFVRYYKTHGDFSRKETITIKPQGIYHWYPAEYHSDLALNSTSIILDFKMINYALDKKNYEVPW